MCLMLESLVKERSTRVCCRESREGTIAPELAIQQRDGPPVDRNLFRWLTPERVRRPPKGPEQKNVGAISPGGLLPIW